MSILNDPSARQQFRSMGELMPPAACAVCGSGTRDEGYIDLGVFVDYHGTLYLCVLCARETAGIIGWTSPEENSAVSAQVNEKLKRLAELEEEVSKLNEYVDSLNTVLRSAYSPASLSNVPVVHGAADAQGVDEPAVTPFSSAGSGEPEVKEPVKSTGRKHAARTEPRITSD